MGVARRPAALLSGVFVLTLATGARAADATAEACDKAAVQGQELRDDHKLVAARDKFRSCSASSCPKFIAQDCTRWLAEVENGLPTVVLAAKDAKSGSYLVDVKVLVDGIPFVTQLDGRAQPLDPGPHLFRFERSDGTSTEQRVPVRQGEKNQSITVVLDGTSTPPPRPVATSAPTEPSRAFPWKTVGWVVGGAGVVGVGVGAVFGLMVGSDKSKANCDAAGFCDAGPLADARSHATTSTIAFAVGGALVATGIAIVIFAPSGEPQKAARLAPALGRDSAGLALEAAW